MQVRLSLVLLGTLEQILKSEARFSGMLVLEKIYLVSFVKICLGTCSFSLPLSSTAVLDELAVDWTIIVHVLFFEDLFYMFLHLQMGVKLLFG